ncbi:DNA methylase N-4/N-6 domain protein [Desulforamulus reducens MI-1]|uniref:DNA methylase N-4/N-6 domain protein n=1 Tax=Desulforamulus reducens (strain ATCC BAA-1160 / DSM 100696 / MI-1) TaxID=349161 RepID=A4J6Q6_DESRM|nr:DNA methylase N-4/N-6 domain protein [Desulforamulus reducens MI-1]
MHTRKNSAIYFSGSHEYVLCYAKHKRTSNQDKEGFIRNLLPREDTSAYTNPDNDPKGPWKPDPITAHNYYSADYSIQKPDGTIIERPQDRYWAFSEETWNRLVKEKAVIWGAGSSMPMVKRYLCDVQDGLVPITLFSREFAGDTSSAKKRIDDILEHKGIFEYTKPIKLLQKLMLIATKKNDIVLDFFSGSASTADALLSLSAEENKGNRKFIMVQLPEETDEKSEAFKAGYKNICEIGKERIRRAGKRILEEHPELAGKLDIGFRVLKVDSTNMQDVYYQPAEITQTELFTLADNIKPDRTPEDLLFQVMLDLGILLSSKIEETTIGGKRVFNVAEGYLLACFDSNVTGEVITEIAKQQPYYAVFRDSSLASDSVAANFEQIFATYSPSTERKVL